MNPYKPVKIGVFGSVARGNQSETSDIDLLYSFSEACGLNFITMTDNLERRLKKKVDLMSFDFMNPYLKESILKEAIIFYDKSSERKTRHYHLLSHSR